MRMTDARALDRFVYTAIRALSTWDARHTTCALTRARSRVCICTCKAMKTHRTTQALVTRKAAAREYTLPALAVSYATKVQVETVYKVNRSRDDYADFEIAPRNAKFFHRSRYAVNAYAILRMRTS